MHIKISSKCFNTAKKSCTIEIKINSDKQKGRPFWIAPCKGCEDRLTILQSPCQNETSLNAVIIPGAHLFFFLWHIMQVTGIQDARTPEKF